MWQHKYNKCYVIQPGEHFHAVLIDYAVFFVIFMSVVLISARFPEPGNLVTMLTLDVPPPEQDKGFVFVSPGRFCFPGSHKTSVPEWATYGQQCWQLLNLNLKCFWRMSWGVICWSSTLCYIQFSHCFTLLQHHTPDLIWCELMH